MKNALVKNAATVDRVNKLRGSDPERPVAARSEWTWIALVCVLLGVSGGIRYWRDWQFRSLSKESEASPFPLKELPKVLGNWRAVEGSETKLDPQVARAAGSSDHLIRTYVNENSGETVSVLVLYGLAQIVFGHTPELCYPATGFRLVTQPRVIELRVPGSTTLARFGAEIYAKNRAGIGSCYEEVYHSFLHAGQWWTGTEVKNRWKSFRYHAGMFKVQVQRQVSGILTEDSSIEGLLGKIAEQIERRLAEGRINQEKTASTAGIENRSSPQIRGQGAVAFKRRGNGRLLY
jgi:hypothetical protein